MNDLAHEKRSALLGFQPKSLALTLESFFSLLAASAVPGASCTSLGWQQHFRLPPTRFMRCPPDLSGAPPVYQALVFPALQAPSSASPNLCFPPISQERQMPAFFLLHLLWPASSQTRLISYPFSLTFPLFCLPHMSGRGIWRTVLNKPSYNAAVSSNDF